MSQPPPSAPPGCLFLFWVGVAFALASIAGILAQKFFPFFFPK